MLPAGSREGSPIPRGLKRSGLGWNALELIGSGAGIEKFSLSLYWSWSEDFALEMYHQKYHQMGLLGGDPKTPDDRFMRETLMPTSRIDR
jgi:hypothetical protein